MKKEDLLIPEKYPKIKRLPIGPRVRGKEETYAKPEDIMPTFKGRVVVEEKMDGSPTMHISTNERFIIFAEDLKIRHSIRYRVPARYAIFDIFDTKKMRFLSREGKEDVFKSICNYIVKVEDKNPFHFFMVPVIFEGMTTLEDIPKLVGTSAFAIDENGNPTWMEGVVAKPNYELSLVEFEKRAGKLVRKEFTEGIQLHYRKKPLQQNIIDPKIWPSHNNINPFSRHSGRFYQ
jgi:hypothetical protein